MNENRKLDPIAMIASERLLILVELKLNRFLALYDSLTVLLHHFSHHFQLRCVCCDFILKRPNARG